MKRATLGKRHSFCLNICKIKTLISHQIYWNLYSLFIIIFVAFNAKSGKQLWHNVQIYQKLKSLIMYDICTYFLHVYFCKKYKYQSALTHYMADESRLYEIYLYDMFKDYSNSLGTFEIFKLFTTSQSTYTLPTNLSFLTINIPYKLFKSVSAFYYMSILSSLFLIVF